jgi:hypothetical protein
MSSERSPGLLLKIIGGICTAVFVAVVLYALGLTGNPPPSTRSTSAPVKSAAVATGSSPATQPGSGNASPSTGTGGPAGRNPVPERDPPPAAFSEVLLDKDFADYLQANPVLMATSGAKVIRLKDDRTVVLAVASTALKDNSAAERLRAEKVCRVSAEASIVAQRQGVQVGRLERLEEKTRVVLEDESEKGRSVSELLQITTTKVEGLVRGMPVIGRWKSKERDVFYLAIGAVCDRDGNPIPQPPE